MADQKNSYGLFVMGLLFLILFSFFVSTYSTSVLFAETMKQIPMTKADVGRIMAMISLAAFLFFPIGGGLADRSGPRLGLGTVGILGAIAGGMRAFSDSANDLMICMFFMGGCVALFYPFIGKVIGSWFAPHQFGKANGAATCVMSFSGAIGVATAANYLSPAFGGWQALFMVCGVVTAAVAIPWLIFYKEGPYVASAKGPSPRLRENYKKVLKNREVFLVGLFTGVNMMGLMTLLSLLPLTMQERGISRAGEFVSLMMVASMIFNVGGGILSDKVGRRKAFIILSSLIQGILAPSLALLNGVPLVLNLLFFGAGMGILWPLILAMPLEMRGIGQARVGTAIGIIMTFSSFGGFLGPFLLGKVMDVKGVMFTFVITGALLILSAAFIFPVQETGKKKEERELESIGEEII